MTLQPEQTTVAFIGTGVMGKSMARNLMKKGFPVLVYTRTKAKAEDLLAEGAEWRNSPGEAAQDANVVITMVGYPSDVEEIYLGKDGIIEKAKQGTYLIDMTTSSPILAQQIYEKAKEKGLYSLDAPVSGGDVGAREGRLSIMVGGDKSAFDAMLPVFEAMGQNIILQGPAGAGQHTKMCNQIAIASNMMGVCEALVYAKKTGLDPSSVLQSIETGAAGSWSLSNLAPRIIKGDYEPGFYVKHFIKDMGIALEVAEQMGVELPGLKLASELYKQLSDLGYGDKGTQALYIRLTESS